MRAEKVREVIEIYREKLFDLGVHSIDYPHMDILDSDAKGLGHCLGMLDQMIVFIDQERMDKVFRWLGFVQGVLWAERIYALEELKNHNRS